MAKFYQHLEQGEFLGKVTQLDYIDDISDDDLILYRFKDGTACSKDFIAAPDNRDAFNGKFAMVELFSPTAQWVIEQKEISLGDKNRTYTDKDGNTWEIPVPGVQINGEYGGGIGEVNATAKDGSIRITATPPSVYGKKQVESDDNYILSAHPELISKLDIINPSNKPKVQTNIKTEKIEETSMIDEIKTEETIETSEENTQPSEIEYKNDNVGLTASEYLTTSDISNTFIMSKQNVTIDYNVAKNSINNITFIDNTGTKYTYDLDTLFHIINQYEDGKNVAVIKEEEKPVYTTSEARAKDIYTIESYLQEEDVLITKLIEKSKKIPSEIGMEISLSLPPKEVYNTVKTVYPENMNEDFIKSLAYRIPIQALISSIASGLFTYYDGEKIEDSEN